MGIVRKTTAIILALFLVNLIASNDAFGSKSYSPKHDPNQYLTNNFIRAMADVMDSKNDDGDGKYEITDDDLFNSDDSLTGMRLSSNSVDSATMDDYVSAIADDENIVPSLRDIEYLQRNPLWGHQFVAGGAGEGKQRLKPAGSVVNKNEVKTDAILPAYCNPPNPCPIGYNAEDGCIEDFENTASFSRTYQAAQTCMCDTEHMFDCPSNHESPFDNNIKRAHRFKQENNPYLEGEKLPVAAKKGNDVGY